MPTTAVDGGDSPQCDLPGEGPPSSLPTGLGLSSLDVAELVPAATPPGSRTTGMG
jgi:hypothetical protein